MPKILHVAIILLGFVASCGASQRTQTIHAAAIAANAAQAGFVAWDASHQAELVQGATSSEDAHARLAAYREGRDEVLRAFVDLYQLIAAAAAIDGHASLEGIASAAAHLQQLLAALERKP